MSSYSCKYCSTPITENNISSHKCQKHRKGAEVLHPKSDKEIDIVTVLTSSP